MGNLHADSMDAIDTLVRFSRRASDATLPQEVMPLLADEAVRHLQADAAAVIGVTETGGLRLVAARHLPDALAGWQGAGELLDELGTHLLAACGGAFLQAYTLPLVNSGDLFGELVLLFRQQVTLPPETLRLGEALVDLAALAMGKGHQIESLRRSNAELRASREVLARSEKLRALGQMAAGVSHDLKNILNPLLMQAQLLKRRSARGEDLGEVLQRMEKVLRRGVDTVERLRHFSRQSPEAALARAQLNDLVREALEICGPRLRAAAELVRVQEELGQPPPVLVQPAEVVSALVNLVVNALDALGGRSGGEIRISTGAAEGGGWARVADNGPGIPAEAEARIFEPFFTTKGTEGTGLGLSMVYALMQRHGGSVSVDNQPGMGAAFTLWFPAAP